MSSTVPELPEQWASLDLVKILAQPAAFVSISQCNSLYKPEGAQGDEKQWERGTLENTIKVANACRAADMKFFWIGYDVFREDYPMTDLDRAQYGSWGDAFDVKNRSVDYKKWDGELVDELKEISRPEDSEFFEYAHQSSFVGTPLKLMLERAGIKTIVLCGIHMDWCIEGNARAARDEGYMPIVIGDACSCQDAADDVATMNRINRIVCPVLSADQAVSLILQGQSKVIAA
ncbi:MAG: isochorismatase family protein [Gammaproteobacteria bacterium]|nr:MAG: isochorismatase family protein [Gammaproteobacteria bacterium]